MTATTRRRAITFRLALLTFVAGAGLFFSPNLVQRAYAFTENRCSVTCPGGSCTATGNCTCTCSFWANKPVCSCGGQEPIESGDTIAN
ncbi:MAG TPA: hypothetical protein VF615_03670 [Longimicrobiaceae bacterium]|jgi:hypothetical protein